MATRSGTTQNRALVFNRGKKLRFPIGIQPVKQVAADTKASARSFETKLLKSLQNVSSTLRDVTLNNVMKKTQGTQTSDTGTDPSTDPSTDEPVTQNHAAGGSVNADSVGVDTGDDDSASMATMSTAITNQDGGEFDVGDRIVEAASGLLSFAHEAFFGGHQPSGDKKNPGTNFQAGNPLELEQMNDQFEPGIQNNQYPINNNLLLTGKIPDKPLTTPPGSPTSGDVIDKYDDLARRTAAMAGEGFTPVSGADVASSTGQIQIGHNYNLRKRK